MDEFLFDGIFDFLFDLLVMRSGFGCFLFFLNGVVVEDFFLMLDLKFSVIWIAVANFFLEFGRKLSMI